MIQLSCYEANLVLNIASSRLLRITLITILTLIGQIGKKYFRGTYRTQLVVQTN